MISYLQETDTRIIFPSIPSISVPYSDTDPTSAGLVDFDCIPLSLEQGFVGDAYAVVRQADNGDVAHEAERLLQLIQDHVFSLRQMDFDLSHLPPIRALNVDDGSTLIEWVFRDFRIGFTVEPNPEESGWYLVSNAELGNIMADGSTFGVKLDRIVLWLLNFALSQT